MILIVKLSQPLNIAAAVMVLGLMSACGQPGPLYLPKPPAKAAPAASAPPPAPHASTPTSK